MGCQEACWRKAVSESTVSVRSEIFLGEIGDLRFSWLRAFPPWPLAAAPLESAPTTRCIRLVPWQGPRKAIPP